MPVPFKGIINLDIRDSKPDWDAFLDRKAPRDAPNVLVILYDDTGQGGAGVFMTAPGCDPDWRLRVVFTVLLPKGAG